jgi:hypothetical protein
VRESGHGLRIAVALVAVVLAVAALLEWSGLLQSNVEAQSTAQVKGFDHGPDFATLATKSIRLLEDSFYNGTGEWHMCYPKGDCNTKNRDWGADALTNVLYLRWTLDRDPTVLPLMRKLAVTARKWHRGMRGSSDSVAWDAVADMRLYQVTRNKAALAKAQAALNYIDSTKGLASGACPAIEYQWPYGALGGLKTIETATNFIKAAILLYRVTGNGKYLTAAQGQYALVRRYFLSKSVPLYSAYMFDNGRTCRVLPGQFFASVNGNMIWSGQALAAATGRHLYLKQAVNTAHAIRRYLSDGTGIFADLQADNDIGAPLMEAMYGLATKDHLKFAKRWLISNAAAAGADVSPAGAFGRFFDGPPPAGTATAWQVNGGIDLMDAAAAIDPTGHPVNPTFWHGAKLVTDNQALVPDPAGNGKAVTTTGHRGRRDRRAGTTPPPGKPVVQISFTGRAIAILGTIGADCCTQGHARVFIDGKQTFDRTGIWQDYTSPSRRQPDQVLFAWRWPTAGHHVITIKPGFYDPEEGGSFFWMTGYLLVKLPRRGLNSQIVQLRLLNAYAG